MVRVANLQDQVEAGSTAKAADGMLPRRDARSVVARARARPARACRPRGRAASCVRRSPSTGSGSSPPRRPSDRGARGARSPVRAPGLPGADPAGDRSRPAVPLHLQPLALARRRAARSREGQRDPRPGQGPEGAARPIPRRRRARPHAGPARRADRRQPRLAVSRDGGRRPLALPGHPRYRLRRLRRGRRHPAGGRGGAAPPSLRRGRAARDRRGDERAVARPAHRGARRVPRRGLRDRRPDRPRRHDGRSSAFPATTSCATRRTPR